MKLFIYLFVYLSINNVAQKPIISVLFDSTSDKKYSYTEGKTTYSLPFYEKIERSNGTEFIINGESFFVKKTNHEVNISSIENIDFITINDIKKDIKKHKYVFKSDIYDTIFLYEKISNKKYIKHRAKLMYYEN